MSRPCAESSDAGRGRIARLRAPGVLCAAAVLLAACAGSSVRDEAERSAAEAGAGEAGSAPPPAEPAALAAHERAVAAMRRGDYIQAELELERLVESYPDLPGPHVNLAILHRRIGRDEAAEAALGRALAIDPGHPEANNQLGILLRQRGEFEAAEAAYLRALERRPGYALALHNLGVLLDVYLRRGAEALEYYERYQEAAVEPDEAVARWIIDLRRRIPGEAAAQVARGEQ